MTDKNDRRLRVVKVLQLGMLAPTLVGMLILGYLWISQEFRDFQKESEELGQHLESVQMDRLKDEVHNAVEYIEYMTTLTESRLKDSIKARTYEAYAIAINIHQRNLEAEHAQLAEMVKESLRPIRYNDGRGYYFAVNMHGVNQILGPIPDREGIYLGEILSLDGSPIVSEMIDIVQRQHEGFYEYTWPKPGAEGEHHRKIAFVKYFKPLDWFIGTGEYLDDVELDIQEEVVERLEQITFGDEGYVFVGQYDGVSLTEPGKGRNMLAVTDVNGVKVVQEIIKAAKKGGGFVNYVLPPFPGRKSSDKVSYVQGIPQWKWYVGAGVFKTDITAELAIQKRELEFATKTRILASLMILGLVTFLALLAAYVVRGRVNRSFSVFEAFFSKAAFEDELIDLGEVHFEEFEKLAMSANAMVSLKRRAEKEAREAWSYLQDMINSMPSIIIGANEDGVVHSWNQSAELVTGVSSHEAVGSNLGKVFPGLASQVERLREAVKTEEITKADRIPMILDGRAMIWDVTIYPLKSKASKGAVLRVDDVTERVRWEEVVVQTEKMVSLGGLAAGMAHEINNPLAAIMQNSEVVISRMTADTPANEKAALESGTTMGAIKAFMEERRIVRMLEAVREAGSRVSVVVNNLLDFSGNKENGFMYHSIPDLLDKTVELASSDYNLQSRYDFRTIKIERDYDPTIPGVACDPARIQQVLFSLLQNAAHALTEQEDSGREPTITLRAVREDGNVRVEVCDNGPGMDKAVRKRVFEPFFTTKGVGRGTGLGLSVSYFIITEYHSGTMQVESEPGKGTCFVMRLPVEGRPGKGN